MSYQFLAIIQEAKDIAREERARPIEACPFCGEPIEQGPSGIVHCRFCGFKTTSPTRGGAGV